MTSPMSMRARDPDEIRAAMKARGDLTQRELGTLARTTYGTIAKILAGGGTSRELAIRIARTLRHPVDELFVAAASSNRQTGDNEEAVA